MSKILVVGFGSLLDVMSVGKTIGTDAAEGKQYTPVIVEGYRRLFNLRPDHYTASSKLYDDGREGAGANVEPAEDHRFNGLAFEVSADEIEALDARERYYERTEITIIDYASGEPMGRGWTYSSDPDKRWIERDVTKLLPRWRDIVYARRGAYAVGKDFGRIYDETTYLADGRTLLVDTYRDLLPQTLDPKVTAQDDSDHSGKG